MNCRIAASGAQAAAPSIRRSAATTSARSVSEKLFPEPVEKPGIGTINPSDLAKEDEFAEIALESGAVLHNTRLPRLDGDGRVDAANMRMLSDPDAVAACTREVLGPGPGVVAYGCTWGSFAKGKKGEAELRQTMVDAGAPKAVTASGAIVNALNELGVRRVSVATPYKTAGTEALASYLGENGIEVMHAAGLGRDSEIWKVPLQEVYDLILASEHPRSEGYVVSCTNLATLPVIAEAEQRLGGRPVISANTALMWDALREVNLPMKAPGKPFRLTELTPDLRKY